MHDSLGPKMNQDGDTPQQDFSKKTLGLAMFRSPSSRWLLLRRNKEKHKINSFTYLDVKVLSNVQGRQKVAYSH